MKRYDMSVIRRLLMEKRNIAAWVREREGADVNSPSAVLYAYDAQAGSYVAALENAEFRDIKYRQAARLASILDELAPRTILDAGTGEATTFGRTLGLLRQKPRRSLGFDISLSRLLHARRFLAKEGLPHVELFAAALERIPLEDDAVDVVVTFHAIEPNHGRESVILEELLRVASRYLVLVEPSWELASAEVRERMERHGYVRGLPEAIARLGYDPIRCEPWGLDGNPSNPAALIVVAKNGRTIDPTLVSPISGKRLIERDSCLFCPEDGHVFPIIAGIPSMLVENAILCSHFDAF
ncbi:MAG: methyltransferase domain-containing protein [Bacteroidales bacterium]|nr:methyltransferase domain-containing protein [Bacteroidales bacterium]